MIEKYLQIECVSIVFIGVFNPVILQPFWLASKKLIREEEATSAKVEIIHNEIVKFDLDWVNIEITKQRCQFKTSKSPYFEAVKDLATSVFKILCETPIRALGINHIYDISLKNSDQYYMFGNKLCPLNIWEDSLKAPKLLHLEILDSNRKDKLPGQYRVRILPSDQKIPFGISFNINDHFDLAQGSKGINQEIVYLLDDQWENSISQAKAIINDILIKTI